MPKTKYVPVREKVKHIQESLQTTRRRFQVVTKGMRRITASKGINPKIKALKIKKAQALQKYLTASIMLDQARIKNLTNPQ